MDASKAASSVLSAVSEGELTPIEGTRVMGLIDSYRRTLELTEIEERLQALEEILYGYYKMMDYQPKNYACLLYTSPSPRDATLSRMPSSA